MIDEEEIVDFFTKYKKKDICFEIGQIRMEPWPINEALPCIVQFLSFHWTNDCDVRAIEWFSEWLSYNY